MLSTLIYFKWLRAPKSNALSHLKDINVIIRGAHGAVAMQFFFAKPNADGTAPSSVGTPNATADGTGYYDNVISAVTLDDTNVKAKIRKVNTILSGKKYLCLLPNCAS